MMSLFARVCLPIGVSLKERTGAQSHSDGSLPKRVQNGWNSAWCIVLFCLDNLVISKYCTRKISPIPSKEILELVIRIVELLLLIVQPTSVSKTGPFELIRWCVISKHHILGCQRQAKSVSFPESNGVEQCIHMGEVFPARFLFRENSMEVTLTPNGNTEPRGVSHTMAA